MASRTKGNSILESLPVEEYGKISRELELVQLWRDQTILDPDRRNDYVYFPTGSVISFLGRTERNGTIEAWSVAHEGAAGISGVLGERNTFVGIVQVPGLAVRAATPVVQRYFEKSAVFRDSVVRYLHCLLTQVSCLGICNNMHPPAQRLSRWLLIMEQRVGNKSLHFTQDAIAALLGTRRATVSEAAARLQAAGAIHYTPGAITIKSRRVLKQTACGCYKSIHFRR
jgi:hypothetical protein